MGIVSFFETQVAPAEGEFVGVRDRPWPVEGIEDRSDQLSALKLSCIPDEAQSERLEVTWGAELRADILWAQQETEGRLASIIGLGT